MNANPGERGEEVYFTPRELAKRFRVSERQITHFARSGTLPAIKIGHLWRFPIKEVEEWERNQGVDKNEVESLAREIVESV